VVVKVDGEGCCDVGVGDAMSIYGLGGLGKRCVGGAMAVGWGRG